MAKDQTKRMSPSKLAHDEASFNALQNVAGYAPANGSLTVDKVALAFSDMRAAQAAEDQASAALDTARDFAVEKEWATHNIILGVKDSIRAQFGKDSAQVQEIGLKRTSEYKKRRPTPKAPK